jgi:hypothetical protein
MDRMQIDRVSIAGQVASSCGSEFSPAPQSVLPDFRQQPWHKAGPLPKYPLVTQLACETAEVENNKTEGMKKDYKTQSKNGRLA